MFFSNLSKVGAICAAKEEMELVLLRAPTGGATGSELFAFLQI